jgi:hypothetical protein
MFPIKLVGSVELVQAKGIGVPAGWCLQTLLLSWCSTKGIGVPTGWCLQTLLLSWCSTKGIGVSCRWVPTNIVVVGWCLQGELSWCSVKGIGVSCRLVPANINSELVLRRGDWCLLQVGACKHCNSRLMPT